MAAPSLGESEKNSHTEVRIWLLKMKFCKINQIVFPFLIRNTVCLNQSVTILKAFKCVFMQFSLISTTLVNV